MQTRTAPLHAWDVSPSEAPAVQRRLARELIPRDDFGPLRILAACDVSYRECERTARAAVYCCTYPELRPLESAVRDSPLRFPYVPGLLTFREGPALLAALADLAVTPDVYLFDGQGIAHPRRMGLAAHMGLWLDKPAVGCAKSRLWGRCGEPPPERGAYSLLRGRRGEVLGAALRTRPGARPVFVSPGHRVGLETAVRIVMTCTGRYRIPEPLRRADRLTR